MADVHVFDEPQDQPRLASPPRHRHDARLVDPAPDDHVDLDRLEPGLARRVDPVEHARDREVDPVHRPEHRVIERVEADGHATQSRVRERPGERAKRRAVGRQRQVELPALRRPESGEHRDQIRQVSPDERLAASDPQLSHATRHERPGDPFDLLEAQNLVSGQERVVAAEDLLGHAVGAAEVAAVGDRDAEVMHRPPEPVGRAGAGHLMGVRDGVHRAMVVPRPGVGPRGGWAGVAIAVRTGDLACHAVSPRRYHRRPLLVRTVNCIAPTRAATMRPRRRVGLRRLGSQQTRTPLMAQTETRPGFRLPWTADRAESGSPVDASDSAAQEMETPEMIDAMAPSSIASPASPSPLPSPQTIGGGAMTPEPPTTTRRPTKLMADLSRAMQAAAEQARGETMTRFDADAKSVVEEMNAASTVEAANLRRRADDDVAAVREWSKAEMARIRERTEERIGQRKTALEGEIDAHATVIKARIERVGARVATYRTEMDDFFGRLLAEQDPTRIATMAELMPEPPSLLEVAASVRAPEVTPFTPAPPPEAPAARPNAAPAAVDFAAAEAEAARVQRGPRQRRRAGSRRQRTARGGRDGGNGTRPSVGSRDDEGHHARRRRRPHQRRQHRSLQARARSDGRRRRHRGHLRPGRRVRLQRDAR